MAGKGGRVQGKEEGGRRQDGRSRILERRAGSRNMKQEAGGRRQDGRGRIVEVGGSRKEAG